MTGREHLEADKLEDVLELGVDARNEVVEVVVVCPEDVDPVADGPTLEVEVKLVADEDLELEIEMLVELVGAVEDALLTMLLVDVTLEILPVLDDAVLVPLMLLEDPVLEDG
ncbi:hypothetical protein CMUS01_15276 [Colletotrichum musicola]|uniref:Uncharacterized protein n=1 Tax=Colletotrichum musicola TaxID=2175873 RepID=A0A8H6IYD3_9PEZI|nr:hypothetical protein CMUS01_15276 [Colletotrichum musicola]